MIGIPISLIDRVGTWYKMRLSSRRYSNPAELSNPTRSANETVFILYRRAMIWSRHPHAPWYLGGLSFAESSFFPIPRT
jgi:hypothetical protein